MLTVLVAAGYWVLATFWGVHPMVSLTIVFVIATSIGYVLHSRWSFKGHTAKGGTAARTTRFFTANTIGYLSNQFFVWFLVVYLGGPTWWPVIPILFFTPVLSFILNRHWVFA